MIISRALLGAHQEDPVGSSDSHDKKVIEIISYEYKKYQNENVTDLSDRLGSLLEQ